MIDFALGLHLLSNMKVNFDKIVTINQIYLHEISTGTGYIKHGSYFSIIGLVSHEVCHFDLIPQRKFIFSHRYGIYFSLHS